MKRWIILIPVLVFALSAIGQKVDSIYFHLYTDSLKKGQYNYINVDGKMADGRWLPLTSSEIEFRCATAEFHGNELIIPEDFKPAKVTIKALLKSNPSIWIERTIWIKQLPDKMLSTEEDYRKNGTRKRG